MIEQEKLNVEINLDGERRRDQT